MIFSGYLRTFGIDPADAFAHRIALHQDDAVDDIRSIADLERAGHALLYERLQDGPLFGPDALVAGFVAEGDGTARLVGLRRLAARRMGVAPGDIIYDPEFAHILHNFIVRAKQPTFYDVMSDLFEGEPAKRGGSVVVRWPDDGPDLLRADDPGLIIAGRDN